MFKAVVIVLSLASGHPVTGFETKADFQNEPACREALDKLLPALKEAMDKKIPGGVGFAAKCENVGIDI